MQDRDLQCEQVIKRFGSVTAVNDVSFEIPSGSFFSILGPSGCGKTTLMRMIAGFDEPDSGDIQIRGKSVLSVPPNRRNVKMVFQHLALFPMMSVGDNIAYGLRCHGVSRAETRRRVDEVLQRIGLPDVASRSIDQLSGGQKQRIAIARCMVLNPDLLLLDEPLGALDLKLREHMKVELKMLQSQFGTTFAYITHDQTEALVMSDQVAVMKDGQFEQVGTPRELYNDPRSPFVAGFVGDSTSWSGTVEQVEGSAVKVRATGGWELRTILANGQDVRPGDAVDVFVRPECMLAAPMEGSGHAPAEDAGCNAFRGRIDSLLFNGSNSRLLVRTGSEQLIEVALPTSGPGAALDAGDAVHVAWEPDQSRCFRQEA